ncbi:uncharacterized protein N7484_003505 [Penicillium longicatenatum]|uniref:uncharacterized protein n=1 Tax=Penicillium longicatenatum TaxID=1561947 RepID=UPI002546E81B|nr:uncharacterized protein N7484_003505 [Penicillium longicatenatum]KAJ5649782.1 hypothetical protein N7484_003505 [Penicillium longicatenatum]
MADDSFFLYGMGERPEALTLGSLVLEKYWQPMSARHYTHELLSDDALREHAYITEITNAVFHGSSRLTPGIGLEAGDIVNLHLAYNKDLERIVTAERGTRVLLKDPETFLINHVLSNQTAQQKLKIWLSAAYSDFVMKFKFARRPKVWMLSGLYLLEDTRTVVSRGQSSKISAGVSSAIIGAVSGVPVGGSVSLGVGSEWEMAMQVAEPHVWAAQFRLLDAKFIKIRKGGMGEVSLPASMGLYRDIMSVNTARDGTGRGVELGLEDGLEQELEGELHDGDVEEKDEQEGLEIEEYEKQLEAAIKHFEKAPKHFLQ